jgi:hypothetical protein
MMLVVANEDLHWHVANHLASGLTVSGCEATALVCASKFGRVGAANEGGSGRRKKLERNLRVGK